MKKILLILAFFSAMFSTVKATEVEIGVDDASIANSTYIPINALWKYGWSQQIYLADEIGMAGSINSITLSMYHTGANPPVYSVNVYMAEVDEDVFATASSWVSLGANDLVFSGTAFSNLPTTAANMADVTIELDTPFEYSGTGNLLIAFANNTGSYVSGLNVKSFGSTSGPKRTLYKYQDSGAIDPTTPGVSGTLYGLRNVITLDITAGEGPTCDKPSGITASDITATGASLAWADGSGVYNVEYKAAADTVWTSVLASTVQMTAALDNLEPSTAYQARVQSVCADTVSGWRSVGFTTPMAPLQLPLIESFNTTSLPANWSKYSGLMSDVLTGTPLAAAGSPTWNFATGNGVFDTHAKLNIYGTSCKAWLVTPILAMQDNVQLTFDLALTTYSGTNAAVDATKQADDIFAVLMSIDNGATWTILRQWDNAGSAYVYNDIAYSAEGEPVVIDLSGHAGETMLIAFYGESTVTSNGDNNLHIDNVSVDRIPDCANPSDLVLESVTKNSASFSWTANAGEEAWMIQYKKSDAAAWITIDGQVTENPFELTGLDTYTNYDVRVAAYCDPADESLMSAFSRALSFKTAAGVPFAENFASLPADWTRYTGLLSEIEAGDTTLVPATAGWTATSGQGVFPEGGNHLRLQVYSTTVNNWIVTPIIEMEDNMQLTFDLALTKNTGTLVAPTPGEQDDDMFAVMLTADAGQTWERLIYWDNVTSPDSYDLINCSANGQTVVVDMTGYAGQSIALAFYGESTVAGGNNYIHVDNFRIDTIPDCEKPMGLVVGEVTASTAAFAWDEAEDAATWAYGVALDTVANFVPADSLFTGSTEDYTVIIDGLEENTSYIFFMRRDCGTAHSDYIYRRFSTIQTPAAVPFVDDFEGANNWLLINGTCTNQWVVGEAANNGGSHALYISDDNGVSNNYTNSASMVYATKTFEFNEDGTYTFKYDWKANGESTYDYIRIALVPAATELEASTTALSGLGASALPTGWIALDGGSKLNLNTAWETKSADLVMQAGLYKVVIAWRNDGSTGYQTPGAIDNFSIQLMLCARPENVALAMGGDSLTTTSALIDWEAQGSEANWLVRYKKSDDAEWTAIEEPVTAHPYLLEGLVPSTTYEVQIAAWCDPADSATISEYSEIFTFASACAAVTEFPWSENFDGITGVTSTSAHVLPICWDYINTTTYSTYSGLPQVYKSTASYSGENLLRFYSYNYVGGSTDYDPQDQFAILPEMENISGLRMKLFARKYSSSYDATFYVGVIDGANFDTIATFSPSSATEYVQYTIMFNEYEGNGTHIAIMMPAPASSYRGVYIDDIVVDPIPTCLEPEDLAVVLTKGNGSVADLNWAAGEASAWVVEYGMDETFAEAVSVPVDTAAISLSGLTSDSIYYARVKAVCGENDESPWSVISFVPTYDLIVSDGTSTNSYVPVYGTYVDDGTTSQFIIPESELESITWDSITKLTFFSSTVSTDWGAAQFEVYMAPVSATTLSSMEAWTNMTKVMDAKSLGIADNQMVVALDYPFQYQGGNLLVGFKQTVTGSYVSCYWYGNTATGASMSAYASNSAVQRNFLPKMQIGHVAGVAPSCLQVKDVQISDITASSAVISWTNGAEEQDAWHIVCSLDPEVDPAEATPIDAASNPFVLAELETDTTYYIYVRANCGEGDYSEWSKLVSFHTAKACQVPDDLAVSNVSISSATISWNTYGQTGFNLRYYTGADTVTVADVAMPYEMTGLEAGTVYYVQVQAACSVTEEEEGEWSDAYGFKTVYGIPFAENFGTTPSEWIKATGLLADVLSGEAQLASTTSGWNVGAANGVFDNHLKINIYGTTYKYWYIAPAVYLNANAQLSFDLALTKYSGTLAEVDKTQQADDKFVVLLTADEGDTWTVLRQWDNAGSSYVYNDIACSADGEPVAIDLSAFNGQTVYVAFYGESTVAGGDNNLHIDNVLIDLIPACPKTTGLHIESVGAEEVTFAWNAEEDATWEYGIVLDTAANFVPADSDFIYTTALNTVTIDELAEQTAYLFFFRKVCGEDESEILYKAFKTIQTPAAIPYYTDFENGNGWTLINGDCTNAWAWGEGADYDANNYGTSKALYISNDGGITNAYTNNLPTMVFATKTFNFVFAGTYSFRYDWKCNGESNYDYMRVALAPATTQLEASTALLSGLNTSSLPAGWIALDGGSKLNLSTAWAAKEVSIENIEPGIYMVVFAWRDDTSGGSQSPAAVDNIRILHTEFPTGIEDGNAGIHTDAVKFLENDHVFIRVNGVIFDATGRQVK